MPTLTLQTQAAAAVNGQGAAVNAFFASDQSSWGAFGASIIDVGSAAAGDTLLVEYDNTQSRANHIHTVWRDPRTDFGRDILAQHYAQAH